MSTPDPATIRRVRVHPGVLGGRLQVPGDKSISHRALLLGALSGKAAVRGLAPSGDVLSTAGALRALGVDVDLSLRDGGLEGVVTGRPAQATEDLDCGNSGTGMRLLAGLCASLDATSRLVGDDSLSQRPMDRIARPLRQMGASVETGPDGRPPLVITGGGLRAIEYDSPVASAQVKSCILLAAVGAGVAATVRSPLPSRDHTERMLRGLGLRVGREVDAQGAETVTLEPGELRAGAELVAPGDPSSAAFWLVAGCLGEQEIVVEGVSLNPTRVGAQRVLEAMGARARQRDAVEVAGEPVGALVGTPGTIRGGTVVAGRTVVDAIDELPILALAGAMSTEGLEVRDAEELRTKESDRIASTARSLGALGITIEERPDGYLVGGGQRPGPGVVDAGGDHRIAMTACIAGTLATGPVEVAGFASVATSYPTFLDDLRRLGGTVEVLDAD